MHVEGEGIRGEGLVHLEPGDSRWPELPGVDPPPRSLWLRGRHELVDGRPCVALVGTRAPTPYGEDQARRFAAALARAGVCVVSGLARGVDQAAHESAMDAGGDTVAVLGCGVDRPWPAGRAAQRVAAEGLLLSEFPPGSAPRRHHFPLRNRLIAGLAQCVLVIEAAQASGSLITARWAADQGRTVFALPGRVDHPMSRGCHRLIREGACLVERPAEILEEIGIAPGPAPQRSTDPVDPQEARILATLIGETLTTDELHTRLDLPMPQLLATLARLELAERVARGPGGLYRRR